MSSDLAYLALRLEGPLQSWGFDSQYNRRNTGLMPTKSAIAGMCCAALGLNRGSDGEREFLVSFAKTIMIAISVPRNAVNKELPVRRLQDYHTVQNTRRASGGINKDCVLTNRQYLTDASFGVVLTGERPLLEQISEALKNPVWGVWLGRKVCVPTTPILAGLKDTETEALQLLIGEQPIETFTRQIEVANFADGRDSLPDMPICFASEKREFAPRRVRTIQAGES